MQRIALFYHPHKANALELLPRWRKEIIARGAPPPIMVSAWDEAEAADVCNRVDLIITLGGDGTLLRGLRIAAPCGLPALGAKLGQVGFLSGLDPRDFSQHIGRLLEGDYWVEERMMVRALLRRDDEITGTYEGVNDVVVSRGQLARVIRIRAQIDGQTLDEFAVDGAIVSTATGSTAYSLAAGGPILAPTVRTMLLTLISPYLSPIHSLVLPEGACVTLKVKAPQTANLTIDGQVDVEVEDGDVVDTQASPHFARFVRLEEPTYFYRTLRDRLREDGG